MVGLWTCSTKTPILNTPILWSQCRISLHPPWLQADSLLRGRWGGSGAAEWLRKPSRITIEPKWNGVPISNKLKVDKGISTEKKNAPTKSWQCKALENSNFKLANFSGQREEPLPCQLPGLSSFYPGFRGDFSHGVLGSVGQAIPVDLSRRHQPLNQTCSIL